MPGLGFDMTTSQGPVLVPKEKLSAVEEVFLSSTRDPKSDVSFDDRVGTAGEQIRRASSEASELEISVTELRKLAKDNSVTTTKPSIGRHVLRTVIGFCIAASIGVGATVAWQPHDDGASRIIADWAVTSLSSLSSALTAKSASHVDVAAERTLPTDVRASANETAPLQPAPYPQAPSLPALAAPSAELVEQVQTVARNLDALRRNVAELAAKQEKMSLNIAKLEAADKEIRQKLAAPRKTAPIASQQSGAQASSVRTPPQATAQSNTQSPSAQSLSTQTGSEGRPGHVIRPVLRED
jgi:hypothetical protein